MSRKSVTPQRTQGAASPRVNAHDDTQEKLAGIGRLTAGVSHDLRTSLASMTNLVYLLEGRIDTKHHELKEYVVLLSREIKRMQGMVDNVMRFVRPSVPVKETVHINDLLTEALLSVQSNVNAYGIQVNLRFSQQLPPSTGDSNQLLRAFINLMMNSVQAMSNGGQLTVRTGQQGNQVQIEICDTGVGMDAETREKIFEPFFTTKTKGTGLGLVVAKQIVDTHEGAMRVYSQPGQGATFMIELPARQLAGGGR